MMSTEESILIVANPTSGRGRGRRTAEAVAAMLGSRGLCVEVSYTCGSGDAERIAREAAADSLRRPACIVAGGGDGTLQEVVNALAPMRDELAERCPTMGIAPAGRCNDFARALGISTDPAAIVDVLASGCARAIDLGKVGDRYFCTVATVGADAEVSSFVDTMKMPLTGTVAYLYGAMCVLARYRSRSVRLSGDFGVVEKAIFLASTANTSSYGGAIRIAPDAVPTDGQLDLCLVDSVSRIQSLRLLPSVLRGTHRDLPQVRFIRTRGFTLESSEELELWADGERIGKTPVEISVAPGAVRVLVPTDFDANCAATADTSRGT